MPKIPTYTAGGSGGGGVPRSPSNIDGGEQYQQISQLGQTLGQGVQQIAQVMGKMQNQRDELEFGLLRSRYINSIKALGRDLVTDPEVLEDPLRYETKFADQARNLQEEMTSQGLNSNVQNLFTNFIQQQFPAQLIEARDAGRKLAIDHHKALLAVNRDADAALAAEAFVGGQSGIAASYIRSYEEQVQRTVERGYLDKEAGAKDLIAFRSLVEEKQMTSLANGGSQGRDQLRAMSRAGMFTRADPTKALTLADANERREDARTAQVMAKATNTAERYLFSQVLTGQLTQDEIDDIKANKNPLIDPRIGAQLQAIKDKPLKAYDPVVDAIALEFGLQEPSMERNRAERKRLMQHVLENGPSETARIRKDHLDGEIHRLRELDQNEIRKATEYAKDAMKATERPSIGGRSGQRQKSREDIDRAEIERKLQRPGADRSQGAVDKMIKELRERRKQRLDQRSDTQKKSDQFSGQGR